MYGMEYESNSPRSASVEFISAERTTDCYACSFQLLLPIGVNPNGKRREAGLP